MIILRVTVQRAAILSLAAIIVGMVASCGLDDCDESGIQYRISSIKGAFIPLSEGRRTDTLAAEASMQYDEFVLLITPVAEYLTAEESSVGSWLSPAYACDPAILPVDQLASVTVLSDTDFRVSDGRVVASGDTLNTFFHVSSPYGSASQNLVEYVNTLPTSAREATFGIVLNSAPAQPQTHRFTVHYALTNGDTFRFSSDPITITP